jgi:hypothetical protein
MANCRCRRAFDATRKVFAVVMEKQRGQSGKFMQIIVWQMQVRRRDSLHNVM